MRKGVDYLFIIWTALVVLMAVSDAAAPDRNFRVSAWLVLLFLGLITTIFVISYDDGLSDDKRHILPYLLTGFLAGAFLGLYSLVWQITMFLTGKAIAITPTVALFPFPITVDAFEWYFMIIIGFGLIFLSLVKYLNIQKHRLTIKVKKKSHYE